MRLPFFFGNAIISVSGFSSCTFLCISGSGKENTHKRRKVNFQYCYLYAYFIIYHNHRIKNERTEAHGVKSFRYGWLLQYGRLQRKGIAKNTQTAWRTGPFLNLTGLQLFAIKNQTGSPGKEAFAFFHLKPFYFPPQGDFYQSPKWKGHQLKSR